jgi:hypothetical protein
VDELKIGLSKLSIFMYPYELKEVCPREITSSCDFEFPDDDCAIR